MPGPWMSLGVVALVLFAELPQATSQADAAQQPRFQASTDVVRVHATVRNDSGHLVTDLQAENFEIRDRGNRVPLALFSENVQPIRVAVMVDVSGAVFDHTTFRQLRDGLSAFVDQFGPDDGGSIGWFSHERIMPGPSLTSNTAELKKQIETEIQIQHVQPLLAALKPNEGAYAVRSLRGRPLWNAIGAATQKLAAEPGRKVILVLANGNNTKNLADYPRLKDLKLAIAGDELMIYAIHGFEPRLSDPSPQSDQITGSAEERQTTLQQLTELTGGGFLTAPFDLRKRTLGMDGVNSNRNPLSLAFRSQLAGIIEELRHQYTLGFVPTKRDGAVGTIDVRVNRPKTEVWARKTYVAPRP